MHYNFNEIEAKWQTYWKENNSYRVENDFTKPKCYVLDMFPYPSGAGLHVGHPLGYIASDIYARYKRLKGFNVLHPMGFDSFGLPAEQYAIETGQHPATTTKINIERYKEQLDKIGFSFDWSREVQTAHPSYYKWTQWIFLQLFNSWYNPATNKAEPISSIITVDGCQLSDDELMNNYRLAYKKESYVNWCEALGTVLANDEVVNGVSERGGHPVERKLMSQWFLRITSFADRLLDKLAELDFPESLKEMQRNWIGKSEGAEIRFEISDVSNEIKDESNLKSQISNLKSIHVFTTRPDTIFGASFMVLAPEHELVNAITIAEQKQAIEEYQKFTSSRSERERMAETKVISGCNTGAYAIHPFTKKQIPIWISEYVLAGYGTGAIMAVPCGDERDYAFAKHFDLDIPNIFHLTPSPSPKGDHGNGLDLTPSPSPKGDDGNGLDLTPSPSPKGEGDDGSYIIKVVTDKNAVLQHSDFLDGLSYKEASKIAIDKLEEMQLGVRKINYRMRDAGFSRQRYWGEPFPIVYDEHGTAIALTDKDLPLELPFLETYSAGPNGKGPLANAKDWVNVELDLTHSFGLDLTHSFGLDLTHSFGLDLTPSPSPKGEGDMSTSRIFTTDANTWKQLITFARANRKNQTEAEAIMWEALRNKNLGSKVRRQHALGSYLADFYFSEYELIIEIDGEYHDDDEQRKSDESRTKVLEEMGFQVLRFSNSEVQQNLSLVLQKIKDKFTKPSSPLSFRRGVGGEVNFPSPLGEGLGVRSNYTRETDTMPGYAGSSWYYLRYMDPHNEETFCDKSISDYWNQVDVYVGGAEHAVGHLLYSRMWCKTLHDLGFISYDEPYKKLINQGMIGGSSRFVGLLSINFRPINSIDGVGEFSKGIFISKKHYEEIDKIKNDADKVISYVSNFNKNFYTFDNKKLKPLVFISKHHVDISLVDGYELDTDKFKKSNSNFANAELLLEDGKYICDEAFEKMSKSKYNVINPDDIIEQYGADTFRMYEMFLGPLEMSKPWDTKGIEGVHRFLKKFWRLYCDETTGCVVTNDIATKEELKALHKHIKKIQHDIENFAFNTSVSQFMIITNELSTLNCHKREILKQVLITLVPFAPHISAELWQLIGNTTSILDAPFPSLNETYLVENSYTYPVAIQGKARAEMEFALDASQDEIQAKVLENEIVQKWMEGKPVKKFIFVKGKMINVVV